MTFDVLLVSVLIPMVRFVMGFGILITLVKFVFFFPWRWPDVSSAREPVRDHDIDERDQVKVERYE